MKDSVLPFLQYSSKMSREGGREEHSGVHTRVIVVVSSLILNKNSRKLLLSRDPSRHRTRICKNTTDVIQQHN